MKFLIPLLIVISGFLIIQIQLLPHRISSTIQKELGNEPKKDTVIKTITADLQNKANMVYFEGTINDYHKSINEEFEYIPIYPQEFWNG